MNKRLISEEIKMLKKLINEISKGETKISKTQDKIKVNSPKEDYFDRKESAVLTFPMKFALLGGSSKDYVDTFSTLFRQMRYGNEKMNTQQILNILAPGIPKEAIGDTESFKKALTGDKIAVNPETGEKINYIQPSISSKEQGEDDVASYEKIGGSRINQHDNSLNVLKRYFTQATKGDKKAYISYNFNAKQGELALRPKGFYQLQFLSRTLAGKYKYEEDEVFVVSKYKQAYQLRAYKILENFYKKAFEKSFLELTGRIEKNIKSDESYQNKIQDSWDKVIKGLMSGKYNVEKDNFGAWAFQVARNNIIDTLKKTTTQKFNHSKAYLAFQENNLTTWDFVENMGLTSSEASMKEIENKAGKKVYRYTFPSFIDAYNYIESHKDSPSFFNKMTPSGRRILNNVKARHSVGKDIGYELSDTRPDSDEEILKQTEEPGSFVELRQFAKNSMRGFGKGYSPVKISPKDHVQEIAIAEKINLSDEEIRNKYWEDTGRLIYYILTNYQSEARQKWKSKPSKTIITAFISKHYPGLDEKEGTAMINKMYNNISTGAAVSNLFKNETTGKIFPEFIPKEDPAKYIEFDNSDRVENAAHRKQMRVDFNENQQKRLNKGEVAFLFPESEYESIAKDAGVIRKFLQKSEGKGNDKTKKSFSKERADKITQLSDIIGKISGYQGIELKENKNKLKNKMNFKSTISESFFKIRKRMLSEDVASEKASLGDNKKAIAKAEEMANSIIKGGSSVAVLDNAQEGIFRNIGNLAISLAVDAYEKGDKEVRANIIRGLEVFYGPQNKVLKSKFLKTMWNKGYNMSDAEDAVADIFANKIKSEIPNILANYISSGKKGQLGAIIMKAYTIKFMSWDSDSRNKKMNSIDDEAGEGQTAADYLQGMRVNPEKETTNKNDYTLKELNSFLLTWASLVEESGKKFLADVIKQVWIGKNDKEDAAENLGVSEKDITKAINTLMGNKNSTHKAWNKALEMHLIEFGEKYQTGIDKNGLPIYRPLLPKEVLNQSISSDAGQKVTGGRFDDRIRDRKKEKEITNIISKIAKEKEVDAKLLRKGFLNGRWDKWNEQTKNALTDPKTGDIYAELEPFIEDSPSYLSNKDIEAGLKGGLYETIAKEIMKNLLKK